MSSWLRYPLSRQDIFIPLEAPSLVKPSNIYLLTWHVVVSFIIHVVSSIYDLLLRSFSHHLVGSDKFESKVSLLAHMLAAKNAGENSPPLDQQDQQSATKTRVSLQERGVYNGAIYINLPSQRDNHVLIATNNFHILSIHVNPIDCSVLSKIYESIQIEEVNKAWQRRNLKCWFRMLLGLQCWLLPSIHGWDPESLRWTQCSISKQDEHALLLNNVRVSIVNVSQIKSRTRARALGHWFLLCDPSADASLPIPAWLWLSTVAAGLLTQHGHVQLHT